MNSNNLNTFTTSTTSNIPSVITIVYHPKNDLNNTTEKRSRLVPGGKISVNYLERVFQLRVVEECDKDGSNPVGIPFDTSTGVSLNPIQLAEDGKFHITGEPVLENLLTLEDFLSINLPHVTYKEFGSTSKTTASTPRSHPREPVNVEEWTGFVQEASNFHFTNAHIMIPKPSFSDTTTPISNEPSGTTKYVSSNIADVFNVVLRKTGPYRFGVHSDITQSLIGQPDHIYYEELEDGRSAIRSFIEDKTVWDLRSPGENESLVEWWKEDFASHYSKSSRLTKRKSIYHVITQVYGYLSFNKLRYGVLTTYTTTWFLHRPEHGTLLISAPVSYSNQNPTLFRCMSYLLDLCNQNYLLDSTPEQSTSPSASSSAEDISHQLTHKYNTRSKDSNMEIPDSFNLSTLKKIIGHGQTGGVYEYIHNGESLAIKVCDIYNNREPYRNLRNEIGIYEHLKPLQGILIPRVRFHGRIGDIYVLAMDRINGVHLNLSIHDNEIANAKINSIVEKLGSFGVEHGDLRKENILVESSENNELKLWIIDFGLAKLAAK